MTLKGITALLNELSIPFQVVGGLAAVAHGGTRPLADIDPYVPEEALKDIGADSARVWDGRTQTWRPARVDFEGADLLEVDGVELPVMPLPQLLDYKRGLARQVDLQDVAELSERGGMQAKDGRPEDRT